MIAACLIAAVAVGWFLGGNHCMWLGVKEDRGRGLNALDRFILLRVFGALPPID